MNVEMWPLKKILRTDASGRDGFASRLLAVLLFLALLLLFWLPHRREAWSQNGTWWAILFFSWVLARAGGFVSLLVERRKSFTLDPLAGVVAILFISFLLAGRLLRMRQGLFGMSLAIFVFPAAAVLIVTAVFRLRCRKPFLEFLKTILAGLLSVAFYWFMLLVVSMDMRAGSGGGDGGGLTWLLIFISLAVGIVGMVVHAIDAGLQTQKGERPLLRRRSKRNEG